MTIQEAAARLAAWDDILVLTHKRPDGDTIGCAVGLCALLRQRGKSAWMLPNPDATTLFTPYLEGYLAPDGFVPSHVVSVDIASQSLFPENAAAWLGKVDLAIDHHPSNEGFAAENCVEADKAACGEIVYKLVELLGGSLTPEIALPLYVAVATDTGCFVYANTNANTHLVAGALMAAGIDYRAVNKRHFRTKSFKRLKLEGMLATQLELFDGGAIAVGAVTLDMMAQLDAHEEDAEDIAAFLGQIEGVGVSVTIRELKPGECKLSVRSGDGTNVSDVCALLGGGGHAAASGCTIQGTPQQAKDAILRAIRQVRNG